MCPVTYIRPITGATDKKKRSATAIMQLHKLSLNSISVNSKNCDNHYKHNIKFVGELSSILSVNCLQFCLWTVFKMCVGELSCR